MNFRSQTTILVFCSSIIGRKRFLSGLYFSWRQIVISLESGYKFNRGHFVMESAAVTWSVPDDWMLCNWCMFAFSPQTLSLYFIIDGNLRWPGHFNNTWANRLKATVPCQLNSEIYYVVLYCISMYAKQTADSRWSLSSWLLIVGPPENNFYLKTFPCFQAKG